MNCCSQGNITLWILIALLVLGSKDGIFCSNIFSGCGLPIIVALLFCSYVLNFNPFSLITSKLYELLISGAAALVNLIL